MKTDRITILTEGDSKTIGWGHVTRSIALQDGLKVLGFDSTILIKGDVPQGLIKRIDGRVFDWSHNYTYMNDDFIFVMDTKRKYPKFKNVYKMTEKIAREFKPVRKEFWTVKNKRRKGEYITCGGTKDTDFKTAKQMAKIMNSIETIQSGYGQTIFEVGKML